MATNLQVRLRHLPLRDIEEGHFELCEAAVPPLQRGEVLVRHHFLSLDPYMRRRMAQAVAGEASLAPGDCMMGRTVGEVLESRADLFRPGDAVLGWGGWQQFAVVPAQELEKVRAVPGQSLSVHLGVLGRPGITAWLGLLHVARLQPGERVVVSSAGGAVGSVAAQIACRLGARVTGIAGGAAKCDAIVSGLGLHACVDHRAPDLCRSLREAMPDGVDVCFENVGGAVLDATLDCMNDDGRIALCGLVSQYHSGPAPRLGNIGRVLDHRLQITGFHVDALAHLHERALDDLTAWQQAGQLRAWETVWQGLQQAPAAFVAMLAGEGRGKTLVRLI